MMNPIMVIVFHVNGDNWLYVFPILFFKADCYSMLLILSFKVVICGKYKDLNETQKNK